jgi:hypothetical protein
MEYEFAQCDCCDDPIISANLNCKTDWDLLKYYGTGYICYFSLRFVFTSILGVLFIMNIYKLIVNILGGYCPADLNQTSYKNSPNLKPCYSDWSTIHTSANYGVLREDIPERIIFLVYFVVHNLFLAFCKQYIDLKHISTDKRILDATDYAIMVDGAHSAHRHRAGVLPPRRQKRRTAQEDHRRSRNRREDRHGREVQVRRLQSRSHRLPVQLQRV